MFDHNILFYFIALRFDLDAPNLRTAVLCLTYNASVNLRSGFLALGFLVDTDGLGVIRLLLVHPSGVDTISTSIIDFYCC